jgi:hypothetical protein
MIKKVGLLPLLWLLMIPFVYSQKENKINDELWKKAELMAVECNNSSIHFLHATSKIEKVTEFSEQEVNLSSSHYSVKVGPSDPTVVLLMQVMKNILVNKRY